MATLNVFEITQNALSKSRVDESKKTTKKSVAKKGLKESKFTKGFKKFGKIPANKIKLESLSFIKEAEEDDEVIDYTPEEDVVLVIDPEMDETPETVEDAEEAAEELVGDYVCKCSICGANYVCDCENLDVNEDLEIEEAECPVCGETGEQIIVGEIAPAEGASTDEDEADEDKADETDAEDEADADDDADVDIDINVDGEDEEDFDVDFEEDEDEYEESISRAKRRTALRRESRTVRGRKPVRRTAKNESRVSARRSMRKPMPAKRVTESKGKEYNFDEATMNRMLTTFAKENYDNVRFVKITKANCIRNRLTLEGVVVTKKGSKRATKFVAENFVPKATMRVNFTETGAFTESAVSKGSQFTVNFKTTGKTITPTALKYNYVVKENRNAYEVTGSVMNESVKRPVRSRRTK